MPELYNTETGEFHMPYEGRLRDDIARDVLLKLIDGASRLHVDIYLDNVEKVAFIAYATADAMLAARASTKKETE